MTHVISTVVLKIAQYRKYSGEYSIFSNTYPVRIYKAMALILPSKAVLVLIEAVTEIDRFHLTWIRQCRMPR